MKLRAQLLLIGLVVLALPLSGWQFARQVEQTLRAGHAESLISSAGTVARQLAEDGELNWPVIPGAGIHVHRPVTAPFLDGYADDWNGFLSAQSRDVEGPVQVYIAESRQTLHLLLEVDSNEQIYSRPGQGDGDQLLLAFSRDDGTRAEVELAPLAPGFIETRGRNAEGWPRVQAYWQPRARGWTVELQLLDPAVINSVSWTLKDAYSADGERRIRQHESASDLALIRPSGPISRTLAAVLPDQTRAWVALPSLWVIGHAERAAGSAQINRSEPGWIDTVLFEGLAGDEIRIGPELDAGTIRLDEQTANSHRSHHRWSTSATRPGVRLNAQVPIVRDEQLLGVLLLEREADQLLLDSNRAVLRLLGITLGVFVLVALLLLGYATWLSERVRRLRD
ncbi:MAG: hypothetical protein AAGJ52_07975, partial [Pseudomonadota bacterium]